MYYIMENRCKICQSVSQFSRSVMCDSLRPHGLQHARPPYPITNSQSMIKLMSIESVMPSNHLILCRPLLLPSIFPSIRVFSNEYSWLISFRNDSFDLPIVQGTL